MEPVIVSAPAAPSTVIAVIAARLPTALTVSLPPAHREAELLGDQVEAADAAGAADEGRRAVGRDGEDVRAAGAASDGRVRIGAAVEVHANRRGDVGVGGDLIVAGEPR